MKLTAEQEAVLLRAARSVPDDMRDKYFALVADELRGERRWRNGDVKAAVCAARQKCCAQKPIGDGPAAEVYTIAGLT